MRHGKRSEGRVAARLRGLGLPSVLSACLILLAAVGAPVSQLLRVAEVAPPSAEGRAESREAPQYKLVLASAIDAPALSSTQAGAKAAENKNTPASQSDVRLFKVLDEQWETAARVQIDADVPAAPELALPCETALAPEPFHPQHVVCIDFSPPNPPARGPPL